MCWSVGVNHINYVFFLNPPQPLSSTHILQNIFPRSGDVKNLIFIHVALENCIDRHQTGRYESMVWRGKKVRTIGRLANKKSSSAAAWKVQAKTDNMHQFRNINKNTRKMSATFCAVYECVSL